MKKLIIAAMFLVAGCEPMPRESEVSVKFTNCVNIGLNRLAEAGREITPEVWEAEREFCLAAAEASTK
jgi:hypothetical protein